MPKHETPFFRQREGDIVICDLCPHRCHLAPSEVGRCRTRQNIDGHLQVLTFGELVAGSIDPIEKKPLFHYHPGSNTFSIASMGCNLSCPFCQNHTLSDGPISYGENVPPEQVVKNAKKNNCRSIALTYSEPMLMLEYATLLHSAAQQADIELVFVTNGQATKRASAHLSTLIQAANVDLKSFSKERYQTVLKGQLAATLNTIAYLKSANVWVEVTTLVIPDFNDSDDELRNIARFIYEIDPAMPWHVSRYHPAHKWLTPGPTPIDTMVRAREIGVAEGLKFVYTGNVYGGNGEATTCPACGSIAIDRQGYRITQTAMTHGRCKQCGEIIAGRGMP